MKKNTHNIIYALAAFVALTVAMCVQVYASGPPPQSNCTANGTGQFKFTVEPKLVITVDDNLADIGGICPGCCYEWICDVDGSDGPQIIFDISGSKNCPIKLTKFGLWQDDDCITFNWFLWYFDPISGIWGPWPPPGNPLYLFDDGHGGGTLKVAAFVWYFCALCCATPGNYDYAVQVDVEYICL